MKDFIGNDYIIGGYVARTGIGNSDAEYGAILFKIVDIDNVKGTLRLMRPMVSFATRKAVVTTTHVTAKRTTKYVVVTPTEKVKNLFDRIILNTCSQQECDIVAKWVHGSCNIV